jgi:hypothetical protein
MRKTIAMLGCAIPSHAAFHRRTIMNRSCNRPMDQNMKRSARIPDPQATTLSPWALEVRAISAEDPMSLVETLTGAILGCGGWVLSRGANGAGTVNLLFEFERQACVEIYSILIAAGVELNQAAHIQLTELCRCTCNHPDECANEVASVDLEVQTFPVNTTQNFCAFERA